MKKNQNQSNQQQEQGDIKFVNVYDFKTQTITSMPAPELSSTMVEGSVAGIDGKVWVDACQLKRSAFRHPPFDEEARDFMRTILATIEEVYPVSLDKFEDNFRRDMNPYNEMRIWANIAWTYETLTDLQSLTMSQKQEYFDVLLRATMMPREHIWETINLRTITRAEAEGAIDLLFSKDKWNEQN